MSRNDYTKYSKETKTEVAEAEVVTTVTETPTVEPTVEPAPIVENKPVHKTGIVSGCTRLNVRNAPRTTAGIVCEIACGTEVEIDEQESTVDFYKVYTSSGIEGYCVKSYIIEKFQK